MGCTGKIYEEKDRLPIGNDFIAGPGQILSFRPVCLLLFFRYLQEVTMKECLYVASTLLTFIGLLLPLSGYKKKEWKKVVFYVAMMYCRNFFIISVCDKDTVCRYDDSSMGWRTGRLVAEQR